MVWGLGKTDKVSVSVFPLAQVHGDRPPSFIHTSCSFVD